VLVFWAVWLLVFHWIDVSWLVLPEYFAVLPENARRAFPYGPMDLFMFLGIGGIFVAALARVAGKASLRPMLDPRLHESVAFQNI
jgi:bacteriorhodopsin